MLRKYVLSWRLNVLVEVHNFNEVGNSFHNFGPLCLTDFWPIVVLQLSTYRLFSPWYCNYKESDLY